MGRAIRAGDNTDIISSNIVTGNIDSGNINSGTINSGDIVSTGDLTAVDITFSGVVINSINPQLNNTYDLGTSALRWRNIYTNDLNLSNEIGDYTIVEGKDDLFLYNNKNKKVYKFLIEEVESINAPPKASQE